ncbi:MAG TPA: hypothetical protein P5186_13850 [Candidatus Paceibacterota bacterium]|nr:hypothetical protein [Verrucomicrobiota bacterium]HRY49127.1 hypothetical protein [Candidatus Paceibacterota bacterium]HSA01611.1 hypothetical protein [Candidatus Paceibacterota bacterium]
MKHVAQLISGLALAGTLLPSLLFFADRITLPQVQFWMVIATIAWFASSSLWMERPAGK